MIGLILENQKPTCGEQSSICNQLTNYCLFIPCLTFMSSSASWHLRLNECNHCSCGWAVKRIGYLFKDNNMKQVIVIGDSHQARQRLKERKLCFIHRWRETVNKMLSNLKMFSPFFLRGCFCEYWTMLWAWSVMYITFSGGDIAWS